MEFDNSFEVPLPPEQAWAVLMDIRRIAPCMPGAELTEIVDPKTYRGKISVRLGPVALAFAGLVTFEDIDTVNYSARVKAQGSDSKGRGGANAAATFGLVPAGTGSRVTVHTDLTLSGSVAQYGRGVGMIQSTAGQIIDQFAKNLRAQLVDPSQTPPPMPAAPPPYVAHAPSIAAGVPPQPLPGPGARLSPAPPSKLSPAPAPKLPPAPPPSTSPPTLPPAAKPISGLSLIARVARDRIAGLFKRRPPG